MDHIAIRPATRVVLGTSVLLALPFAAMQFGNQVAWTGSDFLLAAVMLLGAGTLLEVALHKAGNTAYQLAAVLAFGSLLFLIWANLAVGLVGNEGNPINLSYLGVLAIGVVGSLVARFQARGMSITMFATALATALVGTVALLQGYGPTVEILGVNAFFVSLFAISGGLFRNAGHDE